MAGFRSTAVTLNYNWEHVPYVFYIITVQVLKNMQANFHSFITIPYIQMHVHFNVIVPGSSVGIALATGWTVRGSNPGGGEIFLSRLPLGPTQSPV
jgi:hypothetical protein